MHWAQSLFTFRWYSALHPFGAILIEWCSNIMLQPPEWFRDKVEDSLHGLDWSFKLLIFACTEVSTLTFLASSGLKMFTLFVCHLTLYLILGLAPKSSCQGEQNYGCTIWQFEYTVGCNWYLNCGRLSTTYVVEVSQTTKGFVLFSDNAVDFTKDEKRYNLTSITFGLLICCHIFCILHIT